MNRDVEFDFYNGHLCSTAVRATSCTIRRYDRVKKCIVKVGKGEMGERETEAIKNYASIVRSAD